ncbi:MAG: hypothetical protein V4710_11255 [Verrucomicrobiota bacterium]
MTRIESALELIRSEIIDHQARCTLPSDGGAVDESSLMGTRDAYLGLASTLLELVAGADAGAIERLSAEHAFWHDQVKHCFIPLPNRDARIVGSYLFDSRADHMATLRKFTAWDKTTSQSLDYDPEFQAPNEPRSSEQGEPPARL